MEATGEQAWLPRTSLRGFWGITSCREGQPVMRYVSHNLRGVWVPYGAFSFPGPLWRMHRNPSMCSWGIRAWWGQVVDSDLHPGPKGCQSHYPSFCPMLPCQGRRHYHKLPSPPVWNNHSSVLTRIISSYQCKRYSATDIHCPLLELNCQRLLSHLFHLRLHIVHLLPFLSFVLHPG